MLRRFMRKSFRRGVDGRHMSFARAIALGGFMAAYFLGTYLAETRKEWLWDKPDILPLDAPEVVGILAAVATGTIALQVMAQTAYARPSSTLPEYKHRQLLGLLAMFSVSVSCVLVVAVWLDKDTEQPRDHVYLFSVVALAAMNCFIATDAANRILSVDDENLDVRTAVARHVLAHYRRVRMPEVPKQKRWVHALGWAFQSLAVGAVSGMASALVAGPFLGGGSWLRHYFACCVVTALVMGFTTAFARVWCGRDRFNKVLLAVVPVGWLPIYIEMVESMSALEGNLCFLALFGVPGLISALAFARVRAKSQWLLPHWMPGTVVRQSPALMVRKRTDEAEVLLAGLKERKRKMESPASSRSGLLGTLALWFGR